MFARDDEIAHEGEKRRPLYQHKLGSAGHDKFASLKRGSNTP